MSVLAVAGLSGRTLRYAEIVPGPQPSLRRLGAADFETNVERAVFAEGDPDALAAVTDALVDGLEGTDATELIFAAHPTATTTFFTPLPVGLAADERSGQLRQEAALLADLAPTRVVRARSRSIRTEETSAGDLEWFQTVHVTEAVHGRLVRLASAIGVDDYDVSDTTRASARVAPYGGVCLLVGAYTRHTEIAVVRDGEFVFGTHGPSTAPADTAYFALAALQQSGVAGPEVRHLHVYGDDATDSRLELVVEFIGLERTFLDPLTTFSRTLAADPSELASFAPVLGAAL
ncbi:hypothetical protein [Rubrivirga sp.]|uniref:hypothetical protein n=1 Tax=Rubrivirga sp. TaxID=1885344 RepID=UPI003C724E85